MDLREYLDFAAQTANEAGHLTLGHLRTGTMRTELKPDGSPVKAAYGHVLVAAGRIELMLGPVMNPWDCAPFPPILREAGGYFGDWSGNETIQGGEALSTTRTLLPEVLRLIEDQ